MLANIEGTIAGWLDLLRRCKPNASDQVQLDKIKSEVTQCRAWIVQATQALRLMDDISRA